MNWGALRRPAFLVALGVMAAGAIGMGSAIRMAKVYLDKLPIYPRPIDGRPHVYPEGAPTLLSLPRETRNWKQIGTDRVETEEVEAVLGTTNYLTRQYVEKNPTPGRMSRLIDFHAAYYTDEIDTVPHVPDRCFIGGGMQTGSAPRFLPLNLDRTWWREDTGVPADQRGRIWWVRSSSDYGNGLGRLVHLPRDPDKIEMRIMEFFNPGNDDPIFSGYFFVANGGTVASANKVRELAFNLTDDYAYYLKVQFTSIGISTAEELRDMSASLLNDLFPDIMMCVPDWVEVQAGTWPPDNPRAKRAAGPQAGARDRR